MYSLSRLMLTLAVALLAYCTVLAAILAVLQVPPDKQGLAWAILAVCVIAVIAHGRSAGCSLPAAPQHGRQTTGLRKPGCSPPARA